MPLLVVCPSEENVKTSDKHGPDYDDTQCNGGGNDDSNHVDCLTESSIVDKGIHKNQQQIYGRYDSRNHDKVDFAPSYALQVQFTW